MDSLFFKRGGGLYFSKLRFFKYIRLDHPGFFKFIVKVKPACRQAGLRFRYKSLDIKGIRSNQQVCLKPYYLMGLGWHGIPQANFTATPAGGKGEGCIRMIEPFLVLFQGWMGRAGYYGISV
ncbi:MAG: hypothetical protein V2I46_09990 [Bacteroides sp.]|nr:hypothetical protein [Bacteroides sp.]